MKASYTPACTSFCRSSPATTSAASLSAQVSVFSLPFLLSSSSSNASGPDCCSRHTPRQYRHTPDLCRHTPHEHRHTPWQYRQRPRQYRHTQKEYRALQGHTPREYHALHRHTYGARAPRNQRRKPAFAVHFVPASGGWQLIWAARATWPSLLRLLLRRLPPSSDA